MAVSLVGAVGSANTTAAGSVTGTYGQTPTAGNLLVGVVTLGDGTVVTFAPTASAGWARLPPAAVDNNAAGTDHAGVDMWWKAAAGGDAAPVFTQTTSGTFKLTCLLFELAGANTTAPLDTSGLYQSGTALTASPTMTPTTGANVTGAGEFAISAFCQNNATASTQTWTELGSGYTSAYSDGAVSGGPHTQCNYRAGPTAGATLSDSGNFSTGSANIYAAGLLVTILAAAVAQIPDVAMAPMTGA